VERAPLERKKINLHKKGQLKAAPFLCATLTVH
jgi:hypothetical protein